MERPMMERAMCEAQQLTEFMEQHLPARSIGAVRRIRNGDELLLAPAELDGISHSVVTVRRASGAGRDLARELCARLGVFVAAIPRGADRAPEWPREVVGSISHDASFAAAVVGHARDFGGLGCDIEPIERLTGGIRSIVGTPAELAQFRDMKAAVKLLFSIKEAAFKAVYSRDRMFLDHRAITVDRNERTAVTSYGRRVHWRCTTEPRILVLTWW
jgi:4'-phosphopantetheinyl transferase EntD